MVNRPRICLAIDDQSDHVIVVRAERVRGRCAYTLLNPDDETVRHHLDRGVPCVAVLSARQSFVRWVEAPFGSLRKARRVFPTILDLQLPFPLDECAYEMVTVRRGSNGQARALAVGGRNEAIRSVLDSLAARGIDPVALDAMGLAIWSQAQAEWPAIETTLRAVLFLDGARSCVAVGRGTEWLGVHGCRSGDRDQLERLVQLYRPPPPEGDEKPAVHWIVSGPDVADAARAAAVASDLAPMGTGVDIVQDPALFLARGLATRFLTAGPLRCNLRRGRMAHPHTSRRQRARVRRSWIACLAAGLLLVVSAAIVEMAARARVAHAERVFADLRDRVAGYPVRGAKGAQAIQIVTEAVERRIALQRPFTAPFQPSLLGVFVHLMTTAEEHDLTFDLVRVTASDLDIHGVAPSWEAPERLMPWLLRSGYAAELHRGDAQADESIPFTITTGDPP